jgi:hypothetical protein
MHLSFIHHEFMTLNYLDIYMIAEVVLASH